jgi:hypothetical protein
MREIGIILDLVESRVSQIHVSAVLHLRARLAMPATLKEPQNKSGDPHQYPEPQDMAILGRGWSRTALRA